MFFPRGGSAHVARALARELPAHGCDVTVVVGLAPRPRRRRALLRGLRRPRGALRPRRRADAPVLRGPRRRARPASSPPSTTTAYEAHVAAWSRALEEAGAADADVLHLHHLTPIHEAAARVAPDVPVVGHLHGTELLMLERIADGPPASWHARRGVGAAHAPLGAALRAPAAALAQPARARRARCWASIRAAASSRPTASTPSASRRGRRPRGLLAAARSSTSRTAGARARTRARSPTGPSRRRPLAERARPARRSSRFTEVKRLGLLVRAFARAREALASRPLGRRWCSSAATRGSGRASTPTTRSARPARATSSSPAGTSTTSCRSSSRAADVVRPRLGARAVRLGARRGHGLRPAGRSRSTASGRPTSSRPGHTGWLVEPDDEAALAGALAQAVDHPAERRRRGAAARRDVHAALRVARARRPPVPALRRGRRDARRRRGRRGAR